MASHPKMLLTPCQALQYLLLGQALCLVMALGELLTFVCGVRGHFVIKTSPFNWESGMLDSGSSWVWEPTLWAARDLSHSQLADPLARAAEV